MNADIPRLRMFAGPNGSGKSTFKTMIRKELLGVYINPDEIFDNSTHEHVWLAEITNGQTVEMKTEQIPMWFKKALQNQEKID